MQQQKNTRNRKTAGNNGRSNIHVQQRSASINTTFSSRVNPLPGYGSNANRSYLSCSFVKGRNALFFPPSSPLAIDSHSFTMSITVMNRARVDGPARLNKSIGVDNVVLGTYFAIRDPLTGISSAVMTPLAQKSFQLYPGWSEATQFAAPSSNSTNLQAIPAHRTCTGFLNRAWILFCPFQGNRKG
ncbi:hypothetical protein BGX38DRAFT_240189 [Terfezia claveryi]|nr:hypothetical protein BGX38DRAFT_240189 [Terfezia claveryi]